MNTELLLQETADRVAIRKLIDQYALFADTRDAISQMALFTEQTRFLVFMDIKSDAPTQYINNRKDLLPVFDNLNSYDVTMHFNGQSIITLNKKTANGVTYCISHHLKKTDGNQKLMIAAIRYHDIFIKENGEWFFAERKLLVDWIENR
jgi:hypothetical protein